MVPTLRDGDVVLVRFGGAVHAGDVVVAQFASGPDRLVVKRAERPTADGWWLTGDNPFAGGDSTVHGASRVLGRAVAVWPIQARWPGRWLPRRLPPAPST
ncbi:MAG: S24/S26 family peptidase [Actinomycetota bacterium]